MRKQILLKNEEITNFNLLSDLENKLIKTAIEAAQSAYAPYSKFNVGVALILENNEIIRGPAEQSSSVF